MADQLKREDLDFILESLKYTRVYFDATEYPTPELRRERFATLDGVVEKVRRLRDTIMERERSAG